VKGDLVIVDGKVMSIHNYNLTLPPPLTRVGGSVEVEGFIIRRDTPLEFTITWKGDGAQIALSKQRFQEFCELVLKTWKKSTYNDFIEWCKKELRPLYLRALLAQVSDTYLVPSGIKVAILSPPSKILITIEKAGEKYMMDVAGEAYIWKENVYNRLCIHANKPRTPEEEFIAKLLYIANVYFTKRDHPHVTGYIFNGGEQA
jgi:hypothetical protein